MAISVISVNPNGTVPLVFPENGIFGMSIFSGIVEFVFKGDDTGDVTRDTLSFPLEGRVVLSGLDEPIASCTMSPASFAYDGVVNNALWAVDSASVGYASLDRGSGTGTLEVVGNLAVRGLNGILLRVNYAVFFGIQSPDVQF